MTEPSMIERLARAMWGIAGNGPDADGAEGAPSWRDLVPLARTLLTVMREPSQPMIDASVRLPNGVINACDAREGWVKMIDAALAEEEP